MPTSATAVLAAAEALPFGVAVTDTQGKITWANAAYAELTGCTPDKLLGQSAGAFDWDALAQVAPSSEPWRGQAISGRNTVESFAVEHSVATLRNSAGHATGFWIMKRDATGLRRDAALPHQAEANLLALIESTNDLIWSVDLDYRLLTFNNALRDDVLSSSAVQVAVGMRPQDWMPPERAALWPPMFARALSEGPFRVEYQVLSGRTLELSFNPIRQDGRKTGVSVFGKDITERKTAEHILREAEAKYRNIFEGAVEGVYRTTVQGRSLAANPALAKTLGYDSADELISTITDTTQKLWIDPNERSRCVQLLEDQEVVRGFECQFKRKDGTAVWVSINLRKVCPDEQTAYYEGFIEDITERRRMQDALRKSEEKFAKMFLSSPAITVLLRPDHDGDRYLDVNEAFERASGYRRDEVIGRTSVEIGLWPDPSDFDNVMTQFRADGKLRNVEAHIRTKSGGNRIVSLSADPIEIDGQQCAVVTSINLTEQREAEARLQAQNQRFQRIIESTDAGYFRIGTDGCYEDVNAAWLRMHGFTKKEEAIGLHFSSVQVPVDTAKATKVVEALVEGDSSRSGEFSRLRRDGTIGYHSFSANPVVEGDRVVGVEGFLVDISDQKKAEQERQQNEQQYRSLFNSMQEGVAVHRLISSNGIPQTYVLLDVNRRYEEIIGVRREDVVNKLASEAYGTPDAPYLQEYASVVETGTPCQFETYFPPMDRHFVISVTSMGDDRFATIFFDITEQKRTQQAIQQANESIAEAERHYRLLFNSVSDAVFVHMLRADGVPSEFRDVNENACRLLGYSQEKLLQMRVVDIIAPEEQFDVSHNAKKLLADGNVIWNGLLAAADGRRIPVEVSARVFDMGGSPTIVSSVRNISERKRAESTIQQAHEAIIEAERHYRLMFNSVSDAVFVHTLGEDGLPSQFIEVNDNACRYLGFTREELLRMGPLDILAPEEHSNIPVRAQRLRATGHLIWEGTHVAMDGRRVPVEVNTHLVALDGTPTFISSVRDISDRMEAEKRYRDIFENALEGIYRTSIEGKVLTANPALAKMLGFDSAEDFVSAITQSGSQVWLDPDERHRYTALLEECGGVLGYEAQFKRKDSTLLWVSISGRRVCGADGRTLYYDGFVEDITKRKLAEEKVKISERKFRAAFMTGADAFSIATLKDGLILDVNERFTEVFGYPANEACGRTSTQLGLYADADRGRLLSEITAKGHVSDLDFVARRKNGDLRSVLISANVLEGEGEELLLTVVRDITAQKRTEAEKAKLEDQLRQAQKLESVGRLAGGVAHDFNNLLTVINGYSDFLLKRLKPPDPLRSYASEIRGAGERAASLTKQLLAFSRKQIIEPRVLDLNATIRQSAPMLQRLIGEDLVLRIDLENGLGQVLADPDQVHQVLMNLVVNARDAMPDGGILDIETTNIDLSGESIAAIHDGASPGHYVLMTVTDSGHGMDETVRLQVFEPFFTTKEVGKGTGLGLSTAYGIVRQSRGWIDVSSEVGVGTSFKVYLPRIDAYAVPEEISVGIPTGCGSETVLLAEDQEAVRSLARTALTECGYEVIEASDGGEAMSLAGAYAREIHLLLTDVVMPGMDGKELSERLKKLRPNLKVLFTSGYTADVIAQRGVIERGVAFLHKPFGPEELVQKVREVLDASPLPNLEM